MNSSRFKNCQIIAELYFPFKPSKLVDYAVFLETFVHKMRQSKQSTYPTAYPNISLHTEEGLSRTAGRHSNPPLNKLIAGTNAQTNDTYDKK